MKQTQHSLGFYLGFREHLVREMRANRRMREFLATEMKEAILLSQLIKKFNTSPNTQTEPRHCADTIQNRINQLDTEFSSLQSEFSIVSCQINAIPHDSDTAYETAYSPTYPISTATKIQQSPQSNLGLFASIKNALRIK